MSSLNLTRMSHKFSTALRNLRLHVLRRDKASTGADFAGFASLQGVDPASPKGYDRTGTALSAPLPEAHTSTRSSFVRDEFCEKCGLSVSPAGRESGILLLVLIAWHTRSTMEKMMVVAFFMYVFQSRAGSKNFNWPGNLGNRIRALPGDFK